MSWLKGLSFFEKIAYCLILTAAVFCFNYADIDVTSIHGLAFLDAVKSGKVLQFYSFAIPYHAVPPVYDIAYYFFFGIWELPLWLSGLILDQPVPVWLRIVWCKILLALLYFIACSLTSKLIGHVASGDDAEEYRLWMPLSFFAVFTIFMMGQYDVIYLVIMLYAFTLMIEKRLIAAALLFGVSALFKYFPVFVAVPAFLLVEKRKSRLFQYFGCMILLIIGGKFLSIFDQTPALAEIRKAFFKHMFGRLLAPEIVLGSGKAALFIILYILICFWAYACTDPEGKFQKEKILYFPFLVLCSLFLCILWHVGWLLLLLPFIVLAAAWNPRFKVEIYYASLLLFGGAMVYISGCEHQHEAWFKHSPIVNLLPKMEAFPDEAKYTFISLFNHYELVSMLFLSLIVSGLILLAIFSWPGWKKESPPPEKRLFRWELWLGFGIIPVLVLFFVSLHLLSVRGERKLFAAGSPVLKSYRPSWKKEKESFTNPVIVNGIHLKQKQFSAALCLVPRDPKGFEKNSPVHPDQYDMPLPSFEGIHADLKAVHLIFTDPLPEAPKIAAYTQAGKQIPAELIYRIPDRHVVISVKSALIPAAVSMRSNDKPPKVEEYYLEFDERAGEK